MVELLTDRFLLDGDWDGLERVLLRSADPRIALATAYDLVLLRFTTAVRGPWPFQADYRDVHPAARDAVAPLFDSHKGALFACLDAWRSDDRPAARVLLDAIDRAVAYHGVKRPGS